MSCDYRSVWKQYLNASGKLKESSLHLFLTTLLLSKDEEEHTQTLFPQYAGWFEQNEIIIHLLKLITVRLMKHSTTRLATEIICDAPYSTINLLLRATAFVMNNLTSRKTPFMRKQLDAGACRGTCAVLAHVLCSASTNVLFAEQGPSNNNNNLWMRIPIFGVMCRLLSFLLEMSPGASTELYPPMSNGHKAIITVKWYEVSLHCSEESLATCFALWKELLDVHFLSNSLTFLSLTSAIANDDLSLLSDIAEAHAPQSKCSTHHKTNFLAMIPVHLFDSGVSWILHSHNVSNHLLRLIEHSSSYSMSLRTVMEGVAEDHVIRSPEEAMRGCRILLYQLCFFERMGAEHYDFVHDMLHTVLPACAHADGNTHVSSVLQRSCKLPFNLRDFNTLIHVLRRCVPYSHFHQMDGEGGVDDKTVAVSEHGIIMKRHILVCVLGAMSMFGEYLLQNASYLSAMKPFTVMFESFYCDQDRVMQEQSIHGVVDFLRLYVAMKYVLPSDVQSVASDVCRTITTDVIQSIQHCQLLSPACCEWRILSCASNISLMSNLLRPTLDIGEGSNGSLLDDLFVFCQPNILQASIHLCANDGMLRHHAFVCALLDHLRSVVCRSRSFQSAIIFDPTLVQSLVKIMMFCGPAVGDDVSTYGLHYIERVLDLFRSVAASTEVQHKTVVSTLLTVLQSHELLIISGSATTTAASGVEGPSEATTTHCHHWQHQTLKSRSNEEIRNVPENVMKTLHLCVRILVCHAIREIICCMPRNKRCLSPGVPWIMNAILESGETTSKLRTTCTRKDLESYEEANFGVRVSKVLCDVAALFDTPLTSEETLFLHMDCVHLLSSMMCVAFDGCTANVLDFRAAISKDTLLRVFVSFDLSNDVIGGTVMKSLLMMAMITCTLPCLNPTCEFFSRIAPHPRILTQYDSMSVYAFHLTEFVEIIFRLMQAKDCRTIQNLELQTLRYIVALCNFDDNAVRLVEGNVFDIVLDHLKIRCTGAEGVVNTNVPAQVMPLVTSHTEHSGNEVESTFTVPRTYSAEHWSAGIEVLSNLVVSLGKSHILPRHLHIVFRLATQVGLQNHMYVVLQRLLESQTLQPHHSLRFCFLPSSVMYEVARPIKPAAHLHPVKFSFWTNDSGITTSLWFKVHISNRSPITTDVVLASYAGAKKNYFVDICVTVTRHILVNVYVRVDESADEWQSFPFEFVEYEYTSGEWQFMTLHHTWLTFSNPSRMNHSFTLRLNGTTESQIVQYSFTPDISKQQAKIILSTQTVESIFLGQSGNPIRLANHETVFASSLELGAVNVFNGMLTRTEMHFLYMQGGDYTGDMKESLFTTPHWEVMQSGAAVNIAEDLTTWLTCTMGIFESGKLQANALEPLSSRLICSIAPQMNQVLIIARLKEEEVKNVSLTADGFAAETYSDSASLDGTRDNAASEAGSVRGKSPRHSGLGTPRATTLSSGDDGVRTPRHRRAETVDEDDPMMSSSASSRRRDVTAIRPVSDAKIKVFNSFPFTMSPSATIRIRSCVKTLARTMGGVPTFLWLLSEALMPSQLGVNFFPVVGCCY